MNRKQLRKLIISILKEDIKGDEIEKAIKQISERSMPTDAVKDLDDLTHALADVAPEPDVNAAIDEIRDAFQKAHNPKRK